MQVRAASSRLLERLASRPGPRNLPGWAGPRGRSGQKPTAMKFGKKMIAAMRPEWGANVYVPYKALKQTLSLLADAETAARAEGAFVEQLMQSLQQVNRFYAGREVACAQLLRRLAKVLESPSRWLPAVAEVGRLSSEGVEVSLAALLPQLSTLDEEHAAALREFVDLCGEVDLSPLTRTRTSLPPSRTNANLTLTPTPTSSTSSASTRRSTTWR